MRKHSTRVAKILQKYPSIATGEAQTKNSLIEPFLQCLGYDPSHPEQVALEVSTELGGKIDYVLTGQGNVKIAVEAKRAGAKLSEKEINQLRSYFTFSEAVAAILTNGVDYWLFTDLDKANVMDSEPYMKVDVQKFIDNDINHLETLTRSHVQQSAVHEQAQRERYRTLVNEIVTQELHSPSQEFLRLIGKKAGIKPLTKPHLKLLAPLVGEAISRNVGVAPPSESTLRPSPPDLGPKPPRRDPGPSTTDKPVSTTDSADLTPGKKAALTKARFKAATLFGKPLPATNYREMLTSVVAELQTRHPNDFAERVQNEKDFRGRKWWAISKDPDDLSPHNPKHDSRKVGGYYVDVNLSAEDKVKRAHLFLRVFDHDPGELMISD